MRLPADPVVLLGASSIVGDWQATITPHDAAPDDADVRRQLAEAAGERGVVPGATLANVRQLTAGAGRILDDLGAVAGHARVDTLVGRTTAGSGTLGRALSDPSRYANADSLLRELRALVTDVKAHPKRYVTVKVF